MTFELLTMSQGILFIYMAFIYVQILVGKNENKMHKEVIGNKRIEMKYDINIIYTKGMEVARTSNKNRTSYLGHSWEGNRYSHLRFENGKYVGQVSLGFDRDQSTRIGTWCASPYLHGIYPNSR